MTNKPVESPEAQRWIARKVAVWKASYERGYADVLADALVSQMNVPEPLLQRLDGKVYSD